MKMKAWLQWNYLKDGFSIMFWKFHYLVIFGIFTTLLSLGVLTIGPALLALSSSTRMIAGESGIGAKFYFTEFVRLFKPGVLFSGYIIFAAVSIYTSTLLLSSHNSGDEIIAYIAITAVLVLSFFLIYYPFAAYQKDGVFNIVKKSVYFCTYHIWDTVIISSFLYILWRLMSLSPFIICILFLPVSACFINRFILACNEEVDKKMY